ncbi:MAG: hypothetical protein C0593_14185 [Marinilabiliales bacterium]|nr:MAG: hypothetical protein C0593_14185 [Marinilabiliales bacterium]
MKKITILVLLFSIAPLFSFCQTIDDENGDWSLQHVTLYDTPEAEIMVRTGDIDNLGFGWPAQFNPFSGNSTPRHSFPWVVDTLDASGTDRIMVVTSYEGSPPHGSDGYTANTSRPENLPRPILLNYDLNGQSIESAMLQIFVDDFQAPVWWAEYFVTINNVHVPILGQVVNQLSQTGPIGKIINVSIPNQYYYLLESDSLSILFDDLTTGAADGYAIDFVKLLINPYDLTFSAKVYGNVKDAETNDPLEGATVTASNNDVVITDSEGNYIFSNLPAGINELWVTKFSYDTTRILVDLVAGDSIARDFSINEVLEVEFSADQTTSFAAPLTVQFTDMTSMNPTSWSWDFGDGQTSTDQNPDHTYLEDGVYNVSLTAENAEESNTKTKTSYIQIGVEGIASSNFVTDIIIYPNPFSENAVLSFSLNNSTFIQVDIIDLTGKSGNSVFSGILNSGEHKISIRQQDLCEGVYFLRIHNENYSYIKKMVILEK